MGFGIGEDWEQRLYDELRRADAVIAVVTSSALASTWCSAEVATARAQGCRLMPLRAEAEVVHPLMQRLQSVDYLADPQQARGRVLQALELLDDGGGRWREGDNPFPGLESFTAARSQVFFGREGEAREVGNRLRAMGSAEGMLAIVGPSGCGKSSLLNAAVLPRLDADPDSAWLTVPSLVPGTDPLPELARALTVTATRLGLGWSTGEVRDRLEAGPDGLRRVADDLLAASPGRRRLLVPIDQAESSCGVCRASRNSAAMRCGKPAFEPVDHSTQRRGISTPPVSATTTPAPDVDHVDLMGTRLLRYGRNHDSRAHHRTER